VSLWVIDISIIDPLRKARGNCSPGVNQWESPAESLLVSKANNTPWQCWGGPNIGMEVIVAADGSPYTATDQEGVVV